MCTRNLATSVVLSQGRRSGRIWWNRDVGVSSPFLLELFTLSLLQCKRTLHSFRSAVCRRRSHARRHAGAYTEAATFQTSWVAEVGGHLFPSTANFLLRSLPPALPGTRGGEENRGSAHSRHNNWSNGASLGFYSELCRHVQTTSGSSWLFAFVAFPLFTCLEVTHLTSNTALVLSGCLYRMAFESTSFSAVRTGDALLFLHLWYRCRYLKFSISRYRSYMMQS